MGFKKLRLLCLFVSISMFAAAQTGTVKGTVIDTKTNETLIGASVYLEGTTLGTITDFDGKFIVEKIPAGTYNIKCSFISYETKTVEKVAVKANETVELSFSLGESTVEIEDVKVVAKANRESESMLLMDQKDAAVMKESIGAQQLSAQGVSDAASAATKITGITKQEGAKTLNIRGLGDRYNTTTLNGLPLPSNNAETKNIDLELFSTDLIQFMSVEKIFTPNISSDFAGANVNIVSKKHTGSNFLNFGLKTGFNTENSQADKFYLQDGPSYFGFSGISTPTNIDSYNVFENNWNPQEKTVYPFSGLSLTGGKRVEFSKSALNAFATISFDNEYGYTDWLERKVNANGISKKDLSGEEYKYNTQTTGMLNLNYEKGSDNYYFNSIYLNTSEQSLKDLRGYIFDLAENGALVRRSEFERTSVWVNQLLGENKIDKRKDLKWGLTYNHVNNIMPDRRHNTLDGMNDNKIEYATNDDANNNRYFHDLKEDEYAGNISLDFKFGAPLKGHDFRGKFSVGYSGKYKNRSFVSTQFNHKIIHNQTVTDVQDIDAYFNEENYQNGDFSVKTFSSNFIISSTYDGEQFMNAGFLNLEYDLSQKLLLSAGARIENVKQTIDYKTSLGEGSGEFNELNVFPSLALKYSLTDKSNLRFASSVTYTLPQFKETALFLFEGITDATVGNPYLYPSKDYNADLKWELYPKSGELFSVAVFGKYIVDPINRFVMASASNDFTYANTGDWAKVYGVELEARKNLMVISGERKDQKLFFIGNISLMHTNQELNNEKIVTESEGSVNSNFQVDHEQLQGAAPLIANASLSYTLKWNQSKSSVTPTLVYNYTSERLFLLGYYTIGKQTDKAVQSLDFILKSKIKRFGISFGAKNILNPDIERIQENADEDFLVRSYKKGTKVIFGLSYEF